MRSKAILSLLPAAALLAVAQALKDVPTLLLISFTDEENGKLGSRAYPASNQGRSKLRRSGFSEKFPFPSLQMGKTLL